MKKLIPWPGGGLFLVSGWISFQARPTWRDAPPQRVTASSPTPRAPAVPGPKPLPAIDSVERAKQAGRKRLIRKLIYAGVFRKLQFAGSFPDLWVGPAFDGLQFEQKEQFVNLVYACCIAQSPSYNLLILHDWRTGKKIGARTVTYGLASDTTSYGFVSWTDKATRNWARHHQANCRGLDGS
ncbi:MAG: hypothetical protein HY237_08220 [Acidobacteria bacterium]|nr:hypothetical protein [Acidobacteriota bacterium]